MAAVSHAPDAATQLQNLPFSHLLIGPDKRIAAANPAAEEFLGQSAHKLTGRLLTDVLAFDDRRLRTRFDDAEASIMARRTPIRCEHGPEQIVDIAVAPVAQSAGWHMLTIIEALAGREFIEPAGNDGTQLAIRGPEVLAHEIKNPLAGIKGAAQLLARRCDGQDKEMTSLIIEEVNRLAKLIDGMQSLSQQTSEPSSACNVHGILSRARAIARVANHESIRFVEDFDPSLPPVQACPDSLLQVMLNLIINASEACAGVENPTITLSTKFASGIKLQLSGPDRAIELPIELRISDNGPGVRADMRNHMFSPFVTSKQHGQGLGLALVQKLVGEMNGRVWYERDETIGATRFRVVLPLAPTAKDRA